MKFDQNLLGKLTLKTKDYLFSPRSLRKKKLGALAIETALTLPIVLNLMFFSIEFMRINITESTVDTIAEEVTYAYSLGSCKKSDITDIIKKHLPTFLTEDHICIYIRVYTDPATLCANSPYGGEAIAVKKSGGEVQILTSGLALGGDVDYLDDNYSSLNNPINNLALADVPKSGQAFVVTVTCQYPFSNSFTKMLYNKGVNAKNPGATSFIIWARGAGIIQ